MEDTAGDTDRCTTVDMAEAVGDAAVDMTEDARRRNALVRLLLTSRLTLRHRCRSHPNEYELF